MKTPKIPLNSTAPYETSSPSAEIVANNDHLLYEILLRLPISSLLCFKSVSKQWLSLISNPHFFRQCTPLHNPASGLLTPIQNSSWSISTGATNTPAHPPQLSPSSKTPLVSHSCSPVMGCYSCCSSGLDQRNKCYVYNPNTSHHTILPQLPVDIGVSRTEFSLAFNPSKSPHYIVVCVWICDSITQVQVEIYSSKTVSWRLCTGSFLSHLTPYNVECNGGVF